MYSSPPKPLILFQRRKLDTLPNFAPIIWDSKRRTLPRTECVGCYFSFLSRNALFRHLAQFPKHSPY